MSMPLAAREQLEVSFTIAVTLFVVAALATLKPERVDALLILGVFAIQIIYPTPFVRFAAPAAWMRRLRLFPAVPRFGQTSRTLRPRSA